MVPRNGVRPPPTTNIFSEACLYENVQGVWRCLAGFEFHDKRRFLLASVTGWYETGILGKGQVRTNQEFFLFFVPTSGM